MTLSPPSGPSPIPLHFLPGRESAQDMPIEDDNISLVNQPIGLKGGFREERTGDYPASPPGPLKNIVRAMGIHSQANAWIGAAILMKRNGILFFSQIFPLGMCDAEIIQGSYLGRV